MTSAELQKVRDRVAGASDGPWSVRRIPNSYDSPVGDRYTHPCVRGFRVPRRLYNLAWEQVEADAEFMAQSRQDVPALIEEIDRLRAVVRESREALAELAKGDGVLKEHVAQVEDFLGAEEAHWEGAPARAGDGRRLYMSLPRIRPKDEAVMTGTVTPFPLSRRRSG